MATRNGKSTPRLYLPTPLQATDALTLPPEAARHAQVLRLQPGDSLTLFDGRGGEWNARVIHMGRRQVEVEVGSHTAIEREATREVHLAVAMIAADRMDWLLEKAVELGGASLTPLLTERTNQRFAADRLEKKMGHWRTVVIAASEQCGRNRLLEVRPPQPLQTFLQAPAAGARWFLSPGPAAQSFHRYTSNLSQNGVVVLLSGPEGGFSANETRAVLESGLTPVSLGPRVLRAETAPIAALALLTSD